MASNPLDAPLAILRGLGKFFWAIIKAFLIDWGLMRPAATLADLKFPVLVLRPGNEPPIVDVGAEGGIKAPEQFSSRPINGSIVIDSDFKMYAQQNVRCKQGEITMIFRALLARHGPLTYRFKLKRCWRSGIAAARRKLLACASYGGGIEVDNRKRRELAGQTTMEGIIAVLGSGDGATRPIEAAGPVPLQPLP